MFNKCTSAIARAFNGLSFLILILAIVFCLVMGGSYRVAGSVDHFVRPTLIELGLIGG